MRLYELRALHFGIGPIRLEEAVVARGLCLRTGTATAVEKVRQLARAIFGEKRSMAYGFRPCGLSGFCFGSVASYGGDFAGGGAGAGDQRAVICVALSEQKKTSLVANSLFRA